MAQGIVEGMFGLSPRQAYQQQQAGIDQTAAQYAQQAPFERAAAGMYGAGAGLAGAGAGMLGMVNPEVEAAKQRQATFAQGSLDTPENIRLMAEKFRQSGDFQRAYALSQLADQKEADRLKAQQDAELKTSQIAENIAQANKAMQEKDAAKTKYSSYAQQLIDEGIKPGTPEFTARMREYNLAESKGKEKAGSTSVTTKIEMKTGESLAKEIGPMLKDSKVAAVGAVKLNDAADRILSAIEKNKVLAGPLASQTLTVKQMLGLKGDKEEIARTREVIRALAESSLESRKELQGQGQITEGEAAVAQKAYSGDINDLTVEELRIIANLNKRAAKNRARMHMDMVSQAESEPETKKIAQYYKVRGLESLSGNEPPAIPAVKQRKVVKFGDLP